MTPDTRRAIDLVLASLIGAGVGCAVGAWLGHVLWWLWPIGAGLSLLVIAGALWMVAPRREGTSTQDDGSAVGS